MDKTETKRQKPAEEEEETDEEQETPPEFVPPPQFGIVLSKRKALHKDFVENIKKHYGPDRSGFTVIRPSEIKDCVGGKSYLIDGFIDEFMTLFKIRGACEKKKPSSIILYVLDTDTDKWNIAPHEEAAFTFVLNNEPERYKTMQEFVESLR